MEFVSSRIWTRVAVSISYDDNHWTSATTSFYYPRSNGQAERFVHGHWWEEYTKFFSGLQNYPQSEHRFRPFARRTDIRKKIFSQFSTGCYQVQRKKLFKKKLYEKILQSEDWVFFRGGKSFWEDRIITKRLGRVMYMLKGRRFECKRHLNQLRSRHIKDVTLKDGEELPIEVIYDTIYQPLRSGKIWHKVNF